MLLAVVPVYLYKGTFKSFLSLASSSHVVQVISYTTPFEKQSCFPSADMHGRQLSLPQREPAHGLLLTSILLMFVPPLSTTFTRSPVNLEISFSAFCSLFARIPLGVCFTKRTVLNISLFPCLTASSYLASLISP